MASRRVVGAILCPCATLASELEDGRTVINQLSHGPCVPFGKGMTIGSAKRLAS